MSDHISQNEKNQSEQKDDEIDLGIKNEYNEIPLYLLPIYRSNKAIFDFLGKTLGQQNKRNEQKGQKSGTQSEVDDEEYEEEDDNKTSNKSKINDQESKNEEKKSEQEDDENEEEDDKKKSKTESDKQDLEDISQQEKDDDNDNEQKSQNSEHQSENNKPIPKPEPEEEKKENIEEKKPAVNIQEETEYLDKLCVAEDKIKKELQELGEKWSDGLGTVVMNTQRNKQTEKLLEDLNDIQEKKWQVGERLSGLWEKECTNRVITVKPEDISKFTKEGVEFATKEEGPFGAACNKSVYYVFEKLTGNKSLKGKLANQIYEHVSISLEWKLISGPKGLQKLANDGYIILGCKPEYGLTKEGRHRAGHVVLIVPGEEQISDPTKWNCMVPMVMDTGKGRRETKIMLSQSWGKDKKDEVKYYLYKGHINR